MNTPLTREQQIELMRDADQRMEARVNEWLRDRAFRQVVSKPAPNQESGTIHSRKELKLACG